MSLLDDALDTNLGGVDTAPEFVAPPNGKYKLEIVSAKAKSVDTKNGEAVVAEINYRVLETLELAEADQAPVDAGSLFNESFFLNEKGMPYFKTYLTHMFDNVDEFSLAEAISALTDLSLTAVVKTRTSGDNEYTSTRNQEVSA